jgi:hypothetical protein
VVAVALTRPFFLTRTANDPPDLSLSIAGSAILGSMLADTVMTVSMYAVLLVGTGLVLWAGLHAYALWTIRDLDRPDEG